MLHYRAHFWQGNFHVNEASMGHESVPPLQTCIHWREERSIAQLRFLMSFLLALWQAHPSHSYDGSQNLPALYSDRFILGGKSETFCRIPSKSHITSQWLKLDILSQYPGPGRMWRSRWWTWVTWPACSRGKARSTEAHGWKWGRADFPEGIDI